MPKQANGAAQANFARYFRKINPGSGSGETLTGTSRGAG
jgi:hypothetical protein